MVSIRLTGLEKFQILAATMKGPAYRELRSQLNKSLRAAVKPAVTDIKATVRTLPVTTSSAGTHAAHSRGTARRSERGLRAAIAAGVRTTVDYGRYPGVRIVVHPSLPADQANLPRYLNRPDGWRHPVFGNRHAWVQQRGRPYFEPPILRRQTAILSEIGNGLDAMIRTVERRVSGGS